jgi:hypothetical protein
MKTTVNYKMVTEKQYIGFWNGKTYGGKIYLKGLAENNGYVMVNGTESDKKEIVLETKYIVSKTTEQKDVVCKNGLPTTTEGWMALMEKVG